MDDDESDLTDLHKAAMNGNLEQVTSLLQRGDVAVNATDKYGNTALHLAASRYNPRVFLEIMHNGGDVNALNDDGETPRGIILVNPVLRNIFASSPSSQNSLPSQQAVQASTSARNKGGRRKTKKRNKYSRRKTKKRNKYIR